MFYKDLNFMISDSMNDFILITIFEFSIKSYIFHILWNFSNKKFLWSQLLGRCVRDSSVRNKICNTTELQWPLLSHGIFRSFPNNIKFLKKQSTYPKNWLTWLKMVWNCSKFNKVLSITLTRSRKLSIFILSAKYWINPPLYY